MPEFFPQEFALGLLRLRDERERFRQQQDALREQRAFEQSIQRGQEQRAGAGEERDVAEEKRRRVAFQANQVKMLKTEGVAFFDPTEDIPEFPDEEFVNPITKEKRTIKTLKFKLPSGAIQAVRIGDPTLTHSIEQFQLKIAEQEGRLKLREAQKESTMARKALIEAQASSIKRSGGISQIQAQAANNTLLRIDRKRRTSKDEAKRTIMDDAKLAEIDANPDYGLSPKDLETETNAHSVMAAILGASGLDPDKEARERILKNLDDYNKETEKPGVPTAPAPAAPSADLQTAERAVQKLESGQPLTEEERQAFEALFSK